MTTSNPARVALITAAGSGMGAASARELSAQGWRVAVMSASGKGEALGRELGGVGITGSVLEAADLTRAVQATMTAFGRIDAVVSSSPHPPKGELLANKQMVQEKIADSWIELEQFRLLVLRTAWLIDKHKDYNLVRKDIAAIKVMMPKVYNDIATKAAHLHGALGVSNEMPFMHMVTSSLVMGIADGPTEVHKVTLARTLLSKATPAPGLFPTRHIPAEREAAHIDAGRNGRGGAFEVAIEREDCQQGNQHDHEGYKAAREGARRSRPPAAQ